MNFVQDEMDEDSEDIASLFEPGMKLEAVNPAQSRQISVATVVRVTDRLLWLCLDAQPEVNFVICDDSHNIFPIGWCASNNYPLKAPIRKVLVIAKNKATTTTQSE